MITFTIVENQGLLEQKEMTGNTYPLSIIVLQVNWTMLVLMKKLAACGVTRESIPSVFVTLELGKKMSHLYDVH